MKSFFRLSIILGLLGVFIMQTEAKAAVPKVASFEVYPRGAKVIFVVNVSKEGKFEIPGAFDVNTVTPIVKEGLKIEYFQKKVVPYSAIQESLIPLYKKIEEKKKLIANLDAQVKSHQNNLEMIKDIKEQEVEVKAPEISAYMNSLLELHSKSTKEIALLQMQIIEAKKELATLEDSYNKSLPANYDTIIEISYGASNSKNSTTFEVEAYTNYASWNPSYKMNLNSKTGEVTFSLLANARQYTGMIYNGDIKFFTQQPAAEATAPKINPLIVDFYSNVNVSGSASVKKAAPMEPRYYANQMVDLSKEEEVRSRFVDIEYAPVVEESLTNAVVLGKGRVQGDGSPVILDLGSITYKSKISMFLSRDYGQEAWLISNVEKLEEPMLPGAVELSVDGQSSGYTSIGNVGRGEKLKISFGKMPLVRVNKETDVTKSSAGGILTAGTVQAGYTLEVVNGSSIDAEIELVDRIPYSVSDKIIVDSISVAPAPTTNKENVLTWKFTLKSGESTKFDVGYRIKHPSDSMIYYR